MQDRLALFLGLYVFHLMGISKQVGYRTDHKMFELAEDKSMMCQLDLTHRH